MTWFRWQSPLIGKGGKTLEMEYEPHIAGWLSLERNKWFVSCGSVQRPYVTSRTRSTKPQIEGSLSLSSVQKLHTLWLHHGVTKWLVFLRWGHAQKLYHLRWTNKLQRTEKSHYSCFSFPVPNSMIHWISPRDGGLSCAAAPFPGSREKYQSHFAAGLLFF